MTAKEKVEKLQSDTKILIAAGIVDGIDEAIDLAVLSAWNAAIEAAIENVELDLTNNYKGCCISETSLEQLKIKQTDNL